MTHLTLAYSSCPNDTYIFNALVNGYIDTQDIVFKTILADVETLNQNAEKALFDVTKLSFAAFGSLRNSYALLRTGAALGRGCGPLLITGAEKDIAAMKRPKVAVPGLGTTACLLFKFYMKDKYPGIEPDFIPMPFEKIMPALCKGDFDYGVIIHEGRFVYRQSGLHSLADLGQWWEDKTGFPIPLGCIAVKRSMDIKTAETVETLIRQSIHHADNYPEKADQYIKKHAQELEDEVIDAHIRLYVNAFSKELGAEGEAAVNHFFKMAEAAEAMKPSSLPLFITPP